MAADYTPIAEGARATPALFNDRFDALLKGQSYNVAAYGAVGDGVTDDTLAIQSAIASNRTIVFNPDAEYLVSTHIDLDGLTGVTIEGNGARFTRAGATTTMFFRIVGCTRVKVFRCRLQGAGSAETAGSGSNPPIQIGTTDLTEERINEDIEVAYNTISGGNWTGIMLYGRHGTEGVVKNKAIRVHHNTISDSVNGVFVYKNAEDVQITHNTIRSVGQDGIVFDTRAATDARATEAITGIVVAHNTIYDAGQYGQAIGILLKGQNDDAVVQGNVIRGTGVNQALSANAYGILVNSDFSGTGPTSVSVVNNIIDGVSATNDTGVGIYIGPATLVDVSHNLVRNTDSYGIYVYQCNNAQVAHNRVINPTLATGFGMRIGGNAATSSTNVDVVGNRVIKGTGVGTTGLHFDYLDEATEKLNEVVGFAARRTLVSVTNFDQIIERVLDAESTNDLTAVSYAAGETKTTTLTVTGAIDADHVLLTHNNPANVSGLFWWAYVSAADTVTICVHNPTASPIVLGGGAWYVRVLPQTR